MDKSNARLYTAQVTHWSRRIRSVFNKPELSLRLGHGHETNWNELKACSNRTTRRNEQFSRVASFGVNESTTRRNKTVSLGDALSRLLWMRLNDNIPQVEWHLLQLNVVIGMKNNNFPVQKKALLSIMWLILFYVLVNVNISIVTQTWYGKIWWK